MMEGVLNLEANILRKFLAKAKKSQELSAKNHQKSLRFLFKAHHRKCLNDYHQVLFNKIQKKKSPIKSI